MSTSPSSTQRVKIAVCGEVNSGKTSLLRALYRGANLPDFRNAKTKPIVRVVFGQPSNVTNYTCVDQESVSVDSLEDIPTDGSVCELEIHSTRNDFGACEIVEFPPLRDGHVTKDEIERIARCDILVWLTIGSQAWRLSEKTIIDKIPNREPELSVLAVSRADKFRSKADQSRLATRLEGETPSYFEHGVMMCADPKTLVLACEDDDAWERSGAKELAEKLAGVVKVAQERLAETAHLTADVLPEPEAIEAPDADDDVEVSQRVTSKQLHRPRSRISRRLSRANLKTGDAQPPASSEEEAPLPAADTMPETEEVAPISEAAPEIEEVAPISEAAPEVVEKTEVADVVEAAPQGSVDDTKEIAESLDGFISLVSFNSKTPADSKLICGNADKAKEYASSLSQSAQFLAEDAFYKDPKWVHLSTKDHQIIYRVWPEKGDVLLLACRSSNPGIVRNAFMRISNLETAKTLVS